MAYLAQLATFNSIMINLSQTFSDLNSSLLQRTFWYRI